MGEVKIVAVTQPEVEGINTPDEFIAYCARVSNPSNQANTKTAAKLIKYCADHKHWSIFETVNVVMSVSSTRDIVRQLLRHRSFSFQEFSQRYADPTTELNSDFEPREARLQDKKNRQNSIEINTIPNAQELQNAWDDIQKSVLFKAKWAYDWAIEYGIAKEQARVVLPEGLTKTTLFVNGTLRSWIHWIQVRHHPATQKEHRELAKQAAEVLAKKFPSINEVLLEIVENNYRGEVHV